MLIKQNGNLKLLKSPLQSSLNNWKKIINLRRTEKEVANIRNQKPEKLEGIPSSD